MTEQVGFFGKMKRGWQIAMAGWRFILNNPSCLIFPLISIITQALVFIPLIAYVVIYLLEKKNTEHLAAHQQTQLPSSMIAFYIVILFCAGLVASIMYTALSHYMAQKLENKPTSIFSSLGRAFSRLGTLLAWTAINMILTAIFNWIRKSARDDTFPFNIIASLVAGILQFAWQFLTFFVYPIFALTELSAIGSIKASGETVKKMWGEQIGATFNISLIGFIAILALGFIIWPLSFFILDGSILFGTTPNNLADLIVILICVGLPLMIINLWIATAKTLFKTVAYLHTQGKQVGPFEENFIQTSFITKP